jgi:triacylglycerol lipase
MTIKAYNTSTAILWGEFIEVAYKMYNADPKNTNPPQPDYFPAGWKLLANLNVNATIGIFKEPQMIGFVAQSTSDPSELGFVFRGTIGIFDWFDDCEFLKVDFTDIKNGGKVEDGFCRLYNSLSVVAPGSSQHQNIKDFVATLGSTPSITVSGHSLGGALAILHAAVLADMNSALSPELYTFAAPMVGNTAFVATFEQLVPDSYRIYNKPDIVPTLPGEWLGYSQVNTGIQINSLLYPIKHSLGCYHSILTYLYVLGSTSDSPGDCLSTASDTATTVPTTESAVPA